MGHPKHEIFSRLVRFTEMVAYFAIHKQHTSTLCELYVYVIEFGISCRLICVCVMSSVQDVKPLSVLRILRDKYGWQRACHFVTVMCLLQTRGSACIVLPARKNALHLDTVNMQLPLLRTMGRQTALHGRVQIFIII